MRSINELKALQKRIEQAKKDGVKFGNRPTVEFFPSDRTCGDCSFADTTLGGLRCSRATKAPAGRKGNIRGIDPACSEYKAEGVKV